MPLPSDPAPEQILAERRGEFLNRVRQWQRRSGLARGCTAEQVLDGCLGQVWIELARGLTPSQALRRSLYLDWERPQRRSPLPLLGEYLGRPDHPEPELPPWAREWLDLLTATELVGWRAGRRLPWTHHQRRLILASLARLLAGPGFWDDLRRRCSRLFARAADLDPLPPPLRREARRILQLTNQLELPPGWDGIRRDLSTLAARRPGAGRGSRADASA